MGYSKSIQGVFENVDEAYANYDPYPLCDLLSLHDTLYEISVETLLEFANEQVEWPNEDLPEAYSNMYKYYACSVVNYNDILARYDCQKMILKNFEAEYQDENSDWLVPVMNQLIKDLRITALQSNDRKTINNCSNTIEKYFHWTYSTKFGSKNKRLGVLYVWNNLCHLWMRMKALQNMSKLFKQQQETDDFFEGRTSMSSIVTYKYYTGVYYMREEKFTLATAKLQFAYNYSMKSTANNIRRILFYLIPLKLLTDRASPTKVILEKYNLDFYSKIIKGVRDGNLLLLEQGIQENEKFILEKGLIVVMEKLKNVAVRNMLRKTFLAINNQETVTNNKVPIKIFSFAIYKYTKYLEYLLSIDRLDMLNPAASSDPNGKDTIDRLVDDLCECNMANIIFLNEMKGYIAHSAGKVVLLKTSPFPAVGLKKT